MSDQDAWEEENCKAQDPKDAAKQDAEWQQQNAYWDRNPSDFFVVQESP